MLRDICRFYVLGLSAFFIAITLDFAPDKSVAAKDFSGAVTRTELKKQIGKLEQEFGQNIRSLKASIWDFQTDMKRDIRSIRTDIQSIKTRDDLGMNASKIGNNLETIINDLSQRIDAVDERVAAINLTIIRSARGTKGPTKGGDRGSSAQPTSTTHSSQPTTRILPHPIEGCSNYTFSENIPDKRYVIQHRLPGIHGSNTMIMDRDWAMYKRGFCTSDELWAGLENIYQTTKSRKWKLRIEVTLLNGTERWSEYSGFHLENEANNYRLHASHPVKGNMGSGLISCPEKEDSVANLRAFSTRDRDNDVAWGNCAASSKGGWWHYNSRCEVAVKINTGYNYNGTPYLLFHVQYFDCTTRHWHYALRETKMIILRD